MGARLLQFTNRFTAYSFYAIEVKLGGMILGISPHTVRSRILRFPPKGAPFEIFESIHNLQYLSA